MRPWRALRALLALGLAGSSFMGSRMGGTVTEQILRQKLWTVRKKWDLLGSYSSQQTEDVLASFQLPKDLAERCGLEEGSTWLDAVKSLQGEGLELWRQVEEHPIVEYVPMQCQNCGRRVPDSFPAEEEPGLSEEEPTAEERPYVRSGWFRGPKGPVVFVYRCPACDHKSRWFRSSHPEVTLNPRGWGRLCGEQEDLKAWLAKYLGIRLRVCVPVDWDHVWTEAYDAGSWVPLDRNCLHFARRLNEGIGSWTYVLAIGTPGSGDPIEATEEVTEKYLHHAGGTDDEVAAWRQQIQAARRDATGQSTQSRTCDGHALATEDLNISELMREIQRQFDIDALHTSN